MIQLLALGNNGMNGSGKSTGKEEETSLAFDALLQLSSGQAMEKEEGDKQCTLLNQFVQTIPIIQSYPTLLDEPTEIDNEADSSILSFSQPPEEHFILQQGEMKTANQIATLTAPVLQSLEQDPAPSVPTGGEQTGSMEKTLLQPLKQERVSSEQKGEKRVAPLEFSLIQPLVQEGTSGNQTEPLEGSSLQQLAQRDVLGKETVEKQTVLNPSLLEKDKDTKQKELAGSQHVSGDSPDVANTVNPTLPKINFSSMYTMDSQEKTMFATPVQANQFDQDVSLFLKSALNVQQSKDGIEAAFTLAPEHLGKVDVKVSIKDGHVTAEFLASTPSGKDLLETHVQALRTALETQGLQVDKINISQQSTTSLMGTFSQKGDSNTRQGQQDSKKRNDRATHDQEKEYRDIGLDTGWVSQINTTA